MRVSILLTALLGLGMGGVCSPCRAGDDDAEAALERAQVLRDEGNLVQAAEVLEAALAAADDLEAGLETRLQAALGAALVAADEPYSALQYLGAAAQERGAPADHLAYAEALLAVGRRNASRPGALGLHVRPYLEDALEEASRAVGEDVASARAWLEGEVHYWLGDAQAALAAWEGLEDDFLGDDATSIYRHDLMAAASYQQARYVEAAAAYERAGNLRGAASAWAAARKGAEAIEAYRRLLAGSDVADQLADGTLLGEMLAAARYAGAEAQLAGFLSELSVEGSVAATVLVARARLAGLRGALDASEAFLQRALDADPHHLEALVELGNVRFRRASPGDQDALDAALTPWITALARHPDDARVSRFLWDMAGREYSAAWRSERSLSRSLRVQEAITAADPEDGLAWANLGNTLRIAGRHEEALEAYDRAVRLEAHDPSIASDRGLTLSALGRFTEALVAFEHAAGLDREFDAARQNAGRANWLAGRDDEAERLLAEAARSAARAGRSPMRYRFLLDRTYRTRIRPHLR